MQIFVYIILSYFKLFLQELNCQHFRDILPSINIMQEN